MTAKESILFGKSLKCRKVRIRQHKTSYHFSNDFVAFETNNR
jgi:hypothetical protein